MYDNIAAISSGSYVNQPISIVRVAGPDAVEIVSKIFKGKQGKDHEITYGFIFDGSEMIDEVLIMWFVGKEKNGQIIYNNYCGEPLIEINCHGGIVTTNQVLETLLKNGARLAERGEFTRRAFLNGKIDLVKAEAIHELIFAQTTLQTKASINKFTGKTSGLIDKFIADISYLIGLSEVNIDYPEYLDLENIDDKIMLDSLNKLKVQLQEIVTLSESARYIFEGVKVALVGKPNVGKSSILNALLSEDKAIVTDIAGTTRDTIEASYQIQGMLFKLVDTAGIRESKETVEAIGIAKSFEQIQKADLVIHVFDPTQENNQFDELIYQEAQKYNKTYVKVINKSDLNIPINEQAVSISAKNNQIEQLENELIKHFDNINVLDERILSNTRQISLIKQALGSIGNAIETIEAGMTFDVIIVDLYDAWESLQNIKGNVNKEDLLDVMFKSFCLGK
ncbi:MULTISPECIES: tRNA uridine-5-carboxymethylaminomethyl(34) synthesis GTPase MnmE [unclassified Mycoplasma]|uniref:tRNA uridine-5-carboxymethylaminomethyl(34) synthesis GTPase MnmE n=1 Tax=unclassified Mycoplasma TaxID=2683645 RepID=UPI00211BC324|nr:MULTISPECIES: tRNA uridine-5-carboxymethylaminomethyl(34) synthesis GTPase MnmE [unclassified Mycoplasma]UUM19856.1 tRNA uridine-5-carboxymethylaminomethyl(34) synthesis GTPase MnmE [Mycoplasma sp. 1578d]UUM24840.1 tRNA uridine-5-carboxymethylaminomethyl(34) synthesis GTPase MnmE [Mycoplasma sp. 3686d]